MRVLIVVPRFVEDYGDFYQFPLGLAYIASSLRHADHEVFGLNLNHVFGPVEEIVGSKVRESSIDACASGGLSPFLPQVKRIFRGARLGNRRVLNVGGGGVVSSDPEVSLQVMDIDVGVIGEGEATVCEALAAFQAGRDLRGVAGIVYRDAKGAIMRTGHREPVMDLSQIPWPDYDVLGFRDHLPLQRPLDHHFFQTQPDNAPRAIDMVTSRSCPYSCTFCFHPVGKVYRERPLDEFFRELQAHVDRYQINMVGILDELFSLRKARLLEFCERIKPLKLQWMVQLHVHSADEHVLDAMRDAGCSYISYGIESMNADVLHSMQKKTRRERIEATLERTYGRRIGIQGNLIFGDTAETLETANDTMSWWAHNRKYQVYLSRLQVYPGSPDYIMAIRDGMITDRVTYADDLPIFLNISNMNDANLDAMTFQLDVHGRTLLNVAPVTAFRESSRQLEGRSTAYDIDWSCPRCGHRNSYDSCVLRPDHGASIRVFCRSCRSRWDIRNRAAGQYAPGTNRALEPGPELATPGPMRSAIAEAKARIGAAGREWFGRYRYVKREDRNEELRIAGLELLQDPFDAERHWRFADALATVGALGAARMHLEQAVAVRPAARAPRERLEALMRRADYAAGGETYFVSFSDAPAPFRQSRESGGYNRKHEPAFPVYRRTENRESVSAAGAKRLPIYFRD